MFIMCDVLKIESKYKFVVFCFGPARDTFHSSQPVKVTCHSARSAMSYANGYVSGICEMNYSTPTPYPRPEIFKTVDFGNALDEEQKEELK